MGEPFKCRSSSRKTVRGGRKNETVTADPEAMDPGKAFHHSTVRNKDYQKVWSSSSDPVHFETDVSHEKLESVSEAEAINISSLSQDLTHSHSPIYMETNSTTSDLPQMSALEMIHRTY